MAKPLLFVLGDSISMHYGPYLQKMVARRFRYARKTGKERNLPEAVRNENGGDSRAVLLYLQSMVRQKHWQPEILLLNCGAHDLKTDPDTRAKQVPLPEYRRNLQAIVGLLRKSRRACRVVWVRIAPVDEKNHNGSGIIRSLRFEKDLDAYNAAADRIMKAADILIIDLFTFTRMLDAPLYCDHAHFHPPVRQAQGAFIAGWLLGSGR